MKELSIEEKAKRYDEALIKARNIVNSINVGLIGKDSFEAVFPELAESEDERIRNGLIKLLNCIAAIEYEDNFGITKEEALEWVKRQGMSYTKRDVDDAYLKGVTDTENEKYMCTVGVKDDIISTFGNNPVDACVAMVEKLHELKML